jgi:hypothetical protein
MTDRRQFLKVTGASLVGAQTKTEERLRAGSWQATVSASGEIVSLRDGSTELVDPRLGDGHLRVSVAGRPTLKCDRPAASHRKPDALVFEYRRRSHG